MVLRQLSSDTADSPARIGRGLPQAPAHQRAAARAAGAHRAARPAVHRSDHSTRAEGKPVRRVVLRVVRASGPHGNQWLVFDHASRWHAGRRRREPLPRRPACSATQLLPRLRGAGRRRAAIVAFTEEHQRAPEVRAGAAALRDAARERMTSVVALVVDAERLRTEFMPALLQRSAGQRAAAGRLPVASKRRCSPKTARAFSIRPSRSDDTPVDERSFPLVFFDKELLEFAAPYEQQREIWGAAHRLRPADDSRNRQRQHPAADGADDRAGAGHGAAASSSSPARRRAKCAWPS